jgi:glycosyltransferase involved in cell wall biosynthesis
VKIAFVDWYCDPARPGASGMSDLVWGMAAPLAARGHDVHVVAPYQRPNFAGPVQVHRLWTPPRGLGYRNIVGHLLLAFAAGRALARIPDLEVVHAAEYLSTAVISANRAAPPIVLTTPGNIYERIDNVNHFDRSVTEVYKWAARATARRATAIVATSDEMRVWWQRTGVPAGHLFTIPLGVDRAVFSRRDGAAARLGWAADRPSVLFAGRLQGENGPELLVRALPHILAAVPAAEAHFLGDGPLAGRLRELAAELGVAGAIHWHRSVPQADLPLYYSAATALALPRASRVTPRVLLQAMACGTPVVAFRTGGIVEYVEPASTGLLAQPGDVGDLATQVATLLGDPRLAQRIGENGAAFARDRLDWDIVTARLVDEVYAKFA